MYTSDISDLKTSKGLALEDIITQVHNFIHRGTIISYTTLMHFYLLV